MTEESAAQIAIVDGSNVAHSTVSGKPRLANILLVCDKLESEGIEPVVLVDAALRHQIDEPEKFEAMVTSGRIRQVPAGTDADYFILSFAREMSAVIVSNDRFRDSEKVYPEVSERLIRYMIMNNEIVLERRSKRR